MHFAAFAYVGVSGIGRLVDPHPREEIESAVVDALQGSHPAGAAEVKCFSLPQFAGHVDDLVRSLVR